MKISLRNLPPEMERAIVDKSERDGVSLNKAAIQWLALSIVRDKRHSDFDQFAGSWSQQHAAEFDSALAGMRTIDPQDWRH